MTLPIDPTMATTGPEWQIASDMGPMQGATPAEIEAGAGPEGVQGVEGSSFGDLLQSTLGDLQASQDEAARQAQALATGQASDPTSVVMAVEKAQLQMQLASTLRDKATASIQEVFRTTV